MDFKKAYDSVTWEILYNILMTLVTLIKMCLNETCSPVRVGEHLSGMFPMENGLKQGDALSPLLYKFPLEYIIKRIQVNQDGLNLNGKLQLVDLLMMLIHLAEVFIVYRKTQKLW
jgi:hypothetical protein